MKPFLLSLVFLLISLSRVDAQSTYFPPTTGNSWDTIPPSELGWCEEKIDELYSFLDQEETKAFILLKDGKIVLEKYFGSFNASTNWYWASAGKTLTAFMYGIAQQEGFLNIDSSISTYLNSGWSSLSATQENQILIKHHLSMSAGYDDLLAHDGCLEDSCFTYYTTPNSRWSYQASSYNLLHPILEQAIGSTVNNFLQNSIQQIIGMNGLFYYSNNAPVMWSTARSMARFGLLLQNRGKWNNTEILSDTAYFAEMTNSSQSMNKAYGYLTWLNGKNSFMMPGITTSFPGYLTSNAPPDMFAAMGANGQFINVIPSENMVWIRMGTLQTGGLVPYTLQSSIWSKINQLACEMTVKPNSLQEFTRIYSNGEQLVLSNNSEISSLQLFDLAGKEVLRRESNQISETIDIKILDDGCYFIHLLTRDGNHYSQRIVK